jgi:hypothetical protein
MLSSQKSKDLRYESFPFFVEGYFQGLQKLEPADLSIVGSEGLLDDCEFHILIEDSVLVDGLLWV